MDRDQHAYAALIARLVSARRFGMRLDLARVDKVLAALGRPQDRLPVIVQIGGTNGKGSTVAFVQSIVEAAGLQAGAFTSPHLIRLSERFVAGGREAEPGELIDADAQVSSAEAAIGIELTFFEKLTVMAVCFFASRAVDVAIFEVGLGGRLDATSALGAHIAAVTGVAFDHQEYLGETLAEIAREKAGIFRPGQRAVIGQSGYPEALDSLRDHALAAGVAELTVIEPSDVAAVPEPLGLPGAHQAANAACALAIVSHLEAIRGIAIDDRSRACGLGQARLRGRLHKLADDPALWIDGAHNPQAAETTRAEIERLAPARPLVVVLGVSQGKDAAAIAAALVRDAACVIATQSSNPRALPAEELAAIAARVSGPGKVIEIAAECAAAIDRARALAGSGSILAAGSLFLAGDILQLWTGEPGDPAELSESLRPAE